MSANGAIDNQFEVMSSGGFPIHKSPQTLQEFQYNRINTDDSGADSYGKNREQENMPSYAKMKNKLTSMRKQNINNVTSNILSSNKPVSNSKAQQMRKRTVDDQSEPPHVS